MTSIFSVHAGGIVMVQVLVRRISVLVLLPTTKTVKSKICLSVQFEIIVTINIIRILVNFCALDGLDSLACSHSELKYESYRQLVGLLVRVISPSQGGCLHRTTQTQNKRRQISMPPVEFEPTIPLFERAKTFRTITSRPL
jgi:uncharacterized membrane protein YfhO